MLNGFKQFILRGKVVDLAVGVAIGASFGTVVTAIVKDFITPLVGAFMTKSDFSNLYFVINDSKFMYGDFINALISFVIVASVIYFFVVAPVNHLTARMHKEPPIDPTTKKCPLCLSEIPIDAKRCAFCTQIF